MGWAIDAINKRVSVRTYSDQPIEDERKQKILDLLSSENKGVHGNRVRFELIDLSEAERDEVKSLGTYGFIKGAKMYIAGAVNGGPGAMEDVGYCFEKVILGVTNLGLGTCWLGGTFKRASFARKMSVSQSEVVPAISPIGYAADNRTIRERALRRLARSDQRKPWGEMFFDGDVNVPLTKESAGGYAVALECLRLGPSASNNQPWRVVYHREQGAFHFYLRRTPGYDRLNRAIDLQRLDMGIAMCHFELAAIETGLAGSWQTGQPDLHAGDLEYTVKWIALRQTKTVEQM